MQRWLIMLGVVLVLVGVFWPWLSRLPLGRLPGDIMIERENVRFYFPITTMLLISGLISLIVWILRK